MPTYNRVERIKKCLPSFLKTKVEDVQFIIIDNNSDDGTWDYLQSVAHYDKRVELYKNSQNIGAKKSILRGYSEVRSPYVITLCDDDLMVGDYIFKCLQIFCHNEDISVIHHKFDRWQTTKNRFKDSFTIYPKGEDAIINMFLAAGVLTGLALRMKHFLLRDFSLEENIIYPQVKIVTDMASKYNVAMINDCGMIDNDFGDKIDDVEKNQNRPDCMGINERISYALELKNPLIVQRLAFGLVAYAVRMFLKFEASDVKRSKKFIKSILFTLNNITPYLILYLFKEKKFKIAFYCLLSLLLKPAFLINYIFFLLFVFKEFFSNFRRFCKFIFR
ncbi:glycosyltransferase family 2 protein [Candidatus Pelagibacter sp.]|nr:glycosyltransferase family 2 protein [Candidatus Pelagibacter sp.]